MMEVESPPRMSGVKYHAGLSPATELYKGNITIGSSVIQIKSVALIFLKEVFQA